MMNRFFRLTEFVALSLLAAIMFTGCSDDLREGSLLDDGDTSVEVVMPVEGSSNDSSATRTAISDDGLSMKWVVGDQVALWADVESSGEAYLVGETFQLKFFGSTYDKAEFAGTISKAMTEQQYSYRGFYPVPQSISGKSVTFEIPSTQSGAFDAGLDFRVADPVVGRELTESTLNGVDALSFRSIMHAFKITAPEGYSELDGAIKTLMVTLPVEIAGTATFDMSNAENLTSATLSSGGSSTITLDLSDNTMQAGDGKEVWMFFNPVEGVTGDIEISAVSTNDKLTESYFISLEDHDFLAGRITPINTVLMDELPVTTIQFSTTHDKLGEAVKYITVEAPEGAIFSESNDNTAVVYNNGDDTFTLSYITKFYHDYFKTATLSVQFDSEHALIPASDYSISGIEENSVKNFDVDMPYILYEDFNTITSGKTSDGGNTDVGGTDSTSGDQDNVDLSSYGLYTSGWTACRVSTGTNSGTDKAIRICCRYQYGAGIGGAYCARLDSPQFAYLKSAANVKVKFNYKGGRYSQYKTKLIGGWTNTGDGYTTYNCGSTTTTGGIDGSTDISDSYYNEYQEIDGTNGTSNNTSSQNYNNINKDGEFIIYGATSDTRASWRVSTTFARTDFYGTNGNFWFYIDNITASISAD